MRLVRIATAAAVVVFACSRDASARPGFELFNIQCEQPLATSSGRIYQHPLGNNYPPANADIAADPDLQFDSYVAFGGIPSSALVSGLAPASIDADAYRGHFAPSNTLINNLDWSQPLRHVWYAPFPFGGHHAISSPGPGGNPAVFIGRITTDEGATLVYDRVYAGVKTECSEILVGCLCKDDGTTSYMNPYDPSGPAPVTEFVFRLTSYRLGPVNIPGFGSADVHNLYIEALPNPEWVGDCYDPQPPSGGGGGGGGGHPRPPEPLEPNNAFTQAIPLGPETSLATLNDRFDFYRHRADRRGVVTFEATFENITNVVGEARLYSPSGVLLEIADIVNGQFSISAGGNPGDFVLAIERHAGAGRYWVTPSFEPDAPADTDANGVTDARDLFNIGVTWGRFIGSLGPGEVNADLNGDYDVGAPDLEIALRAMSYDRADYTAKTWKKAMKDLYTRQIRPVESFPAGTTPRVANQIRKAMQQRLQAARP